MVKIFIGNISEDSRASDLRKKFEEHGEVEECDILNRYGFVHMKDDDEAKEAIKNLNDTMFDGHKIAVELSTGKSRGGGRGGGGRGGDRGRGRGRGDRGRDGGRPPRGRGDRFDPYSRDDRMPMRRPPFDDYPHPYDRERMMRHDPYERDPYARDPYDRMPPRDPYSDRLPPPRDPYERERFERIPPRDPYLERDLPPRDPYMSSRDPYGDRPVRDPYAYDRAPSARDPYARPPPEYYGQDRPRSPDGYDERVPGRRPGGFDDPGKRDGMSRGIGNGHSMSNGPDSNGIGRGGPSRIGRF